MWAQRMYHKPSLSVRKQRGVVLIVVIGIVALAAIVASQVAISTKIAFDRTDRYKDYVQARELANFGREWVSLMLFNDATAVASSASQSQGQPQRQSQSIQSAAYDNFREQWAQYFLTVVLADTARNTEPMIELRPKKLHEGDNTSLGDIMNQNEAERGKEDYAGLLVDIEDAQSKFNLNNLTTVVNAYPDGDLWFEAYVALLKTDEVGLEDQAEDLAASLRDWLDQDSRLDPSGGSGAEDETYSRKEPPYRPANRSLSTLGELTLVHGYSVEVIEKITPYVTVLPLRNNQPTLINVNTCSEVLFQIMFYETPAGNTTNPSSNAGGNNTTNNSTNNASAQQQPQLGPIKPIEATVVEQKIIDKLPPLTSNLQYAFYDELSDEEKKLYGERFKDDADPVMKVVPAQTYIPNLITIRSNYFIVNISAQAGEMTVKEKAVLFRELDNIQSQSRREVVEYIQNSRIL